MSSQTLILGSEKALKEKELPVQGERIPFNLDNFLDLPIRSASKVLYLHDEAISPEEAGQLIKMQYPQVELLFVTWSSPDTKWSSLEKNGFSDGFYLPLENIRLEKILENGEALCPVKVMDFSVGKILNTTSFYYLPLNGRFLTFNSSTETFSVEKLRKLRELNISTIFMKESDWSIFLDDYKTWLKEVGIEWRISESERRRNLTIIQTGLNKILKYGHERDQENLDILKSNAFEFFQHYIGIPYEGKLWSETILSCGGDINSQEEFTTSLTILVLLLGQSKGFSAVKVLDIGWNCFMNQEELFSMDEKSFIQNLKTSLERSCWKKGKLAQSLLDIIKQQ